MPGLISATYPIVSAVTVTATGPAFSSTVNTAEYREGQLHVVVSGKAGTTSKLRPYWQTSPDGVMWSDHTAMPTFSNATGIKTLPLATIGRYGRLRWVVSGTAAAVKFAATLIGKW